MTTRTHILLTVTNDLVHDRRMLRICNALSDAGYEVRLIGRELKHSKSLKQQRFQQERLKCMFNKGKLFYAEYNFRLFFYLLLSKTDIFCAIDLDTIVPVYFASALKNKKRVLDAHEYFSEVPEVVARPVTKKIWEWVAAVFIPRFDACYTVSASLAKEFTAKYHTRFEVIRNLPDFISEENNSEGKYLLYQGALNEGRGLEALIKSMKLIDMPLKLAGEGDLSDALRALAVQEGVADKVEFLGFVAPENLPELTRQAYLGLNLLEHKGKSYYYSLANKFFDYIQAEVPVITMNFPEYHSINQQYEVAILLDEVSEEVIVRSVKKLISDKTLYLKLRNECRKAKLVFHRQAEEAKLLRIFKSLS